MKPNSNKEKALKRQQKYQMQESLTNLYMINMSYGILGILLLRYIEVGYANSSTWSKMSPIMMTVTVLFAIGAAAIALLMQFGKIKNLSRAKNYVIFLTINSLICLWIRFYNEIYQLIRKIFPTYSVNSGIRFWAPMIGIVVYLVALFIWYLIKIYKLKK